MLYVGRPSYQVVAAIRPVLKIAGGARGRRVYFRSYLSIYQESPIIIVRLSRFPRSPPVFPFHPRARSKQACCPSLVPSTPPASRVVTVEQAVR